MLQITLEAEDRFSLYTGVGSNDVAMPGRTVTRVDFPSATDAIGEPVPIIYGDTGVSGQSGTLTAPTWVENWGKGVINTQRFADLIAQTEGRLTGFYPNAWYAIGGDQPGSVGAPGSVALTFGAGGSIDRGVIVWHDRIYAMAYAIDASGNPGSPLPYYTIPADLDTWMDAQTEPQGPHPEPEWETLAADDRLATVTFAWPAGATTGWKMRVILGFNYYGVRWMQEKVIDHPTTTAQFDQMAPWDVRYWGEWGFATGATPVWESTYASLDNRARYGWCSLRAYNSTGESPDSLPIYCASGPHNRPVYLEWSAVSGATGYRLYQYVDVAGSAFLRYWDLGNVTSATVAFDGTGSTPYEEETAQTRGVETLYVGKLPDLTGVLWDAHLLCGHAVTAITAVYLDGDAIPSSEYGTNLLVPGGTGYATTFGEVYQDINGRRYTILYTRGQLSTDIIETKQVLSADVQGVETVGDGSGALITSIYAQYAHWLEQWVLQDYQGGDWSVTPRMWGDTPYDVAILDTASFDAAKAVSEKRVAGGYVGAVAIGADGASTVREWIARWNLSADCYSGFSRKSQYAICMIDDDPTTAANAPIYSADLGIIEDSFRIDDDVSAIENLITVRYLRDWVRTTTTVQAGDWKRQIIAQDLDAQASIGEIKPFDLDLWCVTDPAHAYDIGHRRLQRRKFPYRIVTWTADMGGLTVDLGDLVKITHPDGMGANGWVERVVFVIRHEFDPAAMTVTLGALDLDFAYAPVLSDTAFFATHAATQDMLVRVIQDEES